MIHNIKTIQIDFFQNKEKGYQEEFINHLKKYLSSNGLTCEDIYLHKNTIELYFSYHCMNESYYDGYVYFSCFLPIIKTWVNIDNFRIVGNYKQSNRKYLDSYNKDYYYDTVSSLLESYFYRHCFNFNTQEINTVCTYCKHYEKDKYVCSHNQYDYKCFERKDT